MEPHGKTQCLITINEKWRSLMSMKAAKKPFSPKEAPSRTSLRTLQFSSADWVNDFALLYNIHYSFGYFFSLLSLIYTGLGGEESSLLASSKWIDSLDKEFKDPSLSGWLNFLSTSFLNKVSIISKSWHEARSVVQDSRFWSYVFRREFCVLKSSSLTILSKDSFSSVCYFCGSVCKVDIPLNSSHILLIEKLLCKSCGGWLASSVIATSKCSAMGVKVFSKGSF